MFLLSFSSNHLITSRINALGYQKVVILIVLFISLGLFSTGQTFRWAARAGEVYNDYGLSVVADSVGSVYTTGHFRNTTNFNPSGYNSPFYWGQNDVFIQKLDSARNFVWVHSLGSAYMDEGTCLAIDKVGNLISFGYINGSADFDQSFNQNVVPINGYFIQKTSLNGSFRWVKNLIYGVTTTKIDVDKNCNIINTGLYYMPHDLDPSSSGTFSFTGTGTYVLKLDSSGNFLWARNIPGGNGWPYTRLSVDESDNIISLGTITTTADFDPGTSTYTMSPVQGGAYLQKLSSSGNFLWARQYPQLTDVKTDSLDNVYITGDFSGTIDLDPGPGVYTIQTSASTNAFVVKLSPSGNFIWGQQIAKKYYSASLGLYADKNGEIYAYGGFSDTLDVDPGLGTSNLIAPSGGGTYLIKFSSTGQPILGLCLNKLFPKDMTMDGNKNLIITGGYTGTQDFDPGVGTYTFNSAWNSADIFTLKLSQDQCSHLAVRVDTIQNLYCNPGQGFISSSAFGGTSPYSFYWNSGTVNSFSFAPQSPGIYTVTVNDANGCLRKTTANINGPGVINPIITQTNVTCNSTTGQAQVNFNGGISPYTFTWSSSNNTTSLITGLSAGVFSIVVQDSRNCTAAKTFTILADTIKPSLSILYTPSLCPGTSQTLQVSGANSYLWFNNSTSSSVSVSPQTTKNYSVTGYALNGCSTVAQVQVNTFSVPIITASGGTICSGQNFTLAPSGASSYTYGSGNAVVSPKATSTYTIIGSSSQGCLSSNVLSLTIKVFQSPTVSVNSGTICAGDNFTIAPKGANKYYVSGSNWIVTPTISSIYVITGTDINGCASLPAFSTVTVFPKPLISIIHNPTVCSNSSLLLVSHGAQTYTWSFGGHADSVLVHPNKYSNFSVAGTDTNGCISYAMSSVSVMALPKFSVFGPTGVCFGSSASYSVSNTEYSYSWSIGGTNTVVSFSPAQSQTIQALAISNDGCKLSQTINLVVHPVPTVSIIASDSIICPDDKIVLIGSGASSYTWSPAVSVGVPNVPASPPSYTVTGKDKNGCINQAVFSLTLLPSPVVSISVSDSNQCVGSMITIEANGGLNYNWSNGVSGATFSTVLTKNMSYSVTGWNSYGCKGAASLLLSGLPCTGLLQERTADTSVSLFPNPSTGIFNLVNLGEQKKEIVLYELSGRQLKRWQTNSDSVALDISQFTSGCYYLSIREDIQGIGFFKLILQCN